MAEDSGRVPQHFRPRVNTGPHKRQRQRATYEIARADLGEAAAERVQAFARGGCDSGWSEPARSAARGRCNRPWIRAREVRRKRGARERSRQREIFSYVFKPAEIRRAIKVL